MRKIHTLSAGNRGLLNYGTLRMNRSKPNPVRKTFNIILDVVCVILVLVAELAFFSIITSRVQNTPPSLFGYSVMQVQSGSMEESGLHKGENIAIRRVKTDTLKRGDDIAFFDSKIGYQNFDVNAAKLISDDGIGSLKNDNNVLTLLGFFPSSATKVAKAKGTSLVIHRIEDIYEDQNGVRYFVTKGTSNASVDSWYVREDLVIGVHKDEPVPSFIAKAVQTVASDPKYIMALVMLPIVTIVLIVAKNSLAEFNLAYTEDRVLYGNRKLQIPKYIETGVGMALCDQEKILLLAKTAETDKLSTLFFLWRAEKPRSFQKYYLRRRLQLYSYEREEKIRQACAVMHKRGATPEQIADFYTHECLKAKLMQQRINRRVSRIERTPTEQKPRWRWRRKYDVAIEIAREQFKINSRHNKGELNRIRMINKHTARDQFRYGRFRSNTRLKNVKPVKHVREIMDRIDINSI